MATILQLRDYCMQSLHIEWSPNSKEEADSISLGSESLRVDYDVFHHKSEEDALALEFRLESAPTFEGKNPAYEIACSIFGIFEFPKEIEADEREELVRINGTMILYGILRGEIAAFTGSFPGGKFLLPTLYMPDIVAAVEKRKAAASAKE